ncbi:uncharacterized protein PHALS_02297 [Plasmopara halstedii]|uniref:Uncharacterized protein n=1 Tax=Plasmopara halstedii TaxID=4781 RepID=A0A0P1AUJ6_PLAHL|nr:uncharacterized protein PHALS_02297 [Plasmopara halstedii]CEG45967.1 hypothetical protein PHALS_02297 [Plasmopara halstedii]|eukprot:XP_024582336.1 hypothetical protein PHALS_02297 [Plasmopara halstedii]
MSKLIVGLAIRHSSDEASTRRAAVFKLGGCVLIGTLVQHRDRRDISIDLLKHNNRNGRRRYRQKQPRYALALRDGGRSLFAYYETEMLQLLALPN